MTEAKRQLDRFIADLAIISIAYPEVWDTAVREAISYSVLEAYVEPQRDFQMPTEFGMFSKGGNELVKKAVEDFLTTKEIWSIPQGERYKFIFNKDKPQED